MALKDKYLVSLDLEQRQLLERMSRTGTRAARALAHARILLMADIKPEGEGEPDEVIAEAVGVHPRTVARVRRLFATSGLEAALSRKPPTGRQYRKLDGEQEARLVTLACGPAPEGAPAGRSGCWPTAWSSCASSSRSTRRPCTGR